MEIALMLLLSFTSFSSALICGQKDQCVCTTASIVCRGSVPVFAMYMRNGVQLTWDMLQDPVDNKVDYTKVLHGYESVIIINAPLEACFIDGLKQHINCDNILHEVLPGNDVPTMLTQDQTTTDVTDSTSSYDTATPEDRENVITLHSNKIFNVELSMTDKAVIITLAINTVKIGLIGFLTYQILVSLVYIHSRLNMITRVEEKPSCVVNTTHKWMRCFYASLRCLCCCLCKNLKAPSFRGRYIFF